MTISICTLIENTTSFPGFIAEWGQSLYIEADGEMILFDAGPSGTILRNAELMGIELSLVRKIVLSHGHDDHTGGLMDLILHIRSLGFDDEIEVTGHPDIFNARYSRITGRPDRPIGMPFTQDELESLNVRFNLSRESLQITDNMLTTGEVTFSQNFEKVDKELIKEENGNLVPDEIADDLSLIIKSSQGLIVLLGCGHRGVVNTIVHAQRLTGIDKIYAVIGGIHLMRADNHQISETIKALQNFNIEKIGVSHCTGLRPACRFANEFGDRFFFNTAGTRTELSA